MTENFPEPQLIDGINSLMPTDQERVTAAFNNGRSEFATPFSLSVRAHASASLCSRLGRLQRARSREGGDLEEGIHAGEEESVQDVEAQAGGRRGRRGGGRTCGGGSGLRG